MVFAHVTKRGVVEYCAAEDGDYAEDKVGVFRHGMVVQLVRSGCRKLGNIAVA